MKAETEGMLRRITMKLLLFFLRLYLVPLKKILYLKVPPGSRRDGLRHSLKAHLVGNAQTLAKLLDPDMPELRAALQDEKTKVLHRLLSADDHAIFSNYINDPDNNAVKALEAYYHPGSAVLKDLMLADNLVRLKALLKPESKTLEKVMFSDDAVRLKSVLSNDDHTKKIVDALRISFLPGDAILYDLMGCDDSERLRAVLSQNDCALARNVFGTRSNITDTAFAHNKYKTLREFLFENDYATLIQVLAFDAKGVYPRLLVRENAPIPPMLTGEEGKKLLRDLLFRCGVMHAVAQENSAKIWCEFEREWDALKAWFPQDDSALTERRAANRAMLNEHKTVNDCLLDTVYENEEVVFHNGALRFTERHALLTLLKEILVNEDYYAPIERPAPRIIDCGAHQGLSLYYFKTIYPTASVTAFEPDPVNRAIAEDNMRRNNFSDVEILPHALAATEGVQHFYVYRGQSMASSLIDRKQQLAKRPDDTDVLEVTCVRLSDYLQEDIDYLKLDIEGAEDEVLLECGGHLQRVHYLFCEYHHLPDLPRDRLVRILALLDSLGFDIHVTKAYNFGRRSQHRPMNYIENYYSAIIFAKNRNFVRQVNHV